MYRFFRRTKTSVVGAQQQTAYEKWDLPALQSLERPLAAPANDVLLVRGEGRPLVDGGVGQVTEGVVVGASLVPTGQAFVR